MTLAELVNAMKILRSIDGWELPDEWSDSTKEAFLRGPWQFLLHSDDSRQAALWEIIRQRMTASHPATPAGSSGATQGVVQ